MIINFCSLSKTIPQALFLEPERFLTYNKLDPRLYQCPAIADFYKNKFIIKSPFDFSCEVERKEDHLLVKTQANEILRSNFFETSISNDLQLIIFDYVFWSDEDVEMEVIPISIDNLLPIAGMYNIKNWIRPIHPSYHIYSSVEKFNFNIKREDPYLYVKFNTKEKVELKYNFDKYILEESKKMARSSMYMKGFRKFFKAFEKIRPRKLTK